LTPQIEQITRLRQQLLQEGLKIALEVHGVLTPEQRTKAAQLKERVRALRGDLRNLLTEFE
jgi:Spy/CpxP family protein refolding chaperone